MYTRLFMFRIVTKISGKQKFPNFSKFRENRNFQIFGNSFENSEKQKLPNFRNSNFQKISDQKVSLQFEPLT